MAYSRKIVLKSRAGGEERLEGLVADFLRDGVAFVGVVGPDCARVEDLIDEIVVGDGNQDHYLLTSSHPGETVDQAVAFAKSLGLDLAGGEVQVIDI